MPSNEANNIAVATFVDIKTVKTRGQMQFIFECPIEDADAAMAALGGVPQSGKERWFVIAPMPADYQNVNRPISDDAKAAIQRSAMLSKDPRFWKIVPYPHSQDEAGAVDYIREFCGIASRSEIATKQYAYDQFLRLEEAYKEKAGLVPVQR